MTKISQTPRTSIPNRKVEIVSAPAQEARQMAKPALEVGAPMNAQMQQAPVAAQVMPNNNMAKGMGGMG
jgi:hypothetical protein